ncbi:MAG: HNH endonuclease [Deltaproteobacteria bacterium]|nr:HNH endonuclease [Deltaproteobacteria bacterium]
MTVEPDLVNESQINREKEKARHLRKSQWWRNRIHKGICHYCGAEVGRDRLTMDHVVPLSRGGKSRKGNVVPCCKECNSRKRTMLPIEWEEYLVSLSDRVGDE